jgi:hypothetical protein
MQNVLVLSGFANDCTQRTLTDSLLRLTFLDVRVDAVEGTGRERPLDHETVHRCGRRRRDVAGERLHGYERGGKGDQ